MIKNNKLDFLIIGTQKGGTSALDYYLRKHPEIEMAKIKELHFFDNEMHFARKKISYKKLHKHFSFSNTHKIYGEATPIYQYWNPCIERIWNYNKNIKLISILRNPIERAFSHWNMEFDRRNEEKNFGSCILKENERAKQELPFQHRVYSYSDRGYYSEQIRRIFRFFNKDQVIFIKYENFKNDPQKVIKQILNFLEVSTTFNFEKKDIHKRQYHSKLSNSDKMLLYNMYKHDICEVERLLNWDCSDWKL